MKSPFRRIILTGSMLFLSSLILLGQANSDELKEASPPTLNSEIKATRDISIIADITINNGDTLTTNPLVSVAISATNDPTEMILSEDPEFGDAVWQPFITPASFQLSDGNGMKTVWVKLRNVSGESDPASEEIEYLIIPEPVNDLCIRVDNTTSNVYLTWSPVVDAMIYSVYADTMPDIELNPSTLIFSTQEPYYIDPGILPVYNSRYYTVTSSSFIAEEEGMVWIPAGWFTMGNNSVGTNAPEHQVYLDGYYIDIYEVSNGKYREYCDATGVQCLPSGAYTSAGMPDDYFDNYPDYPLVGVRWDEACAYCEWKGKRLPTEAEWERAAKGNQDNRYWPWGNQFNMEIDGTIYHTNLVGDADGYELTAPVAHYPTGVSPTGCYDMAGNVNDHCWDHYDPDYYTVSPDSNPRGPETGVTRIRRGGSWHYTADWGRCSQRYWLIEVYRGSCSFRCVKNP